MHLESTHSLFLKPNIIGTFIITAIGGVITEGVHRLILWKNTCLMLQFICLFTYAKLQWYGIREYYSKCISRATHSLFLKPNIIGAFIITAIGEVITEGVHRLILWKNTCLMLRFICLFTYAKLQWYCVREYYSKCISRATHSLFLKPNIICTFIITAIGGVNTEGVHRSILWINTCLMLQFICLFTYAKRQWYGIREY